MPDQETVALKRLAEIWGAQIQSDGSVTFSGAPKGLTGRTRVRFDWRGRVLLQVEQRLPHWGRGWPSPPKFGQPDTRPTYVIWRDARQADLRSLEPPFVGEAS